MAAPGGCEAAPGGSPLPTGAERPPLPCRRGSSLVGPNNRDQAARGPQASTLPRAGPGLPEPPRAGVGGEARPPAPPHGPQSPRSPVRPPHPVYVEALGAAVRDLGARAQPHARHRGTGRDRTGHSGGGSSSEHPPHAVPSAEGVAGRSNRVPSGAAAHGGGEREFRSITAPCRPGDVKTGAGRGKRGVAGEAGKDRAGALRRSRGVRGSLSVVGAWPTHRATES